MADEYGADPDKTVIKLMAQLIYELEHRCAGAHDLSVEYANTDWEASFSMSKRWRT